MTWTVTFRLVRDTPPTDEERDALVRHSRAVHRSIHDYDLVLAITDPPDGVMAHGQVERYYDPHDAEVQRLLEVLTQLRDVVAGARVEVWDDYGLIGYNSATARYDFMGQCDVERFSLPPLSEARRKVSDLPDDHEFGPAAWTARPVPVPVPVSPSANPTVTLAEPPSIRVHAEGWQRELVVEGWLHNPHEALAALEQLQVALRDSEGRILDVLESGIVQPAATLQYLQVRTSVSQGVLADARQADLWLAYRYEIDQPLARLSLDGITPPLEETYRLGVAAERGDTEPGTLPVSIDLRVFHGHGYTGYIQVVGEVTSPAPLGDLSGWVRMAARDEEGMALGAAEEAITFPSDNSAAVVSLSLDLPRARIPAVRQVALDLVARRELHVHLGRFALNGA